MNNDAEQHENQWQSLHVQLQDLLAGYADHELGKQEKSIVEAHLSGCKTCRQDLARQQLLIQRLQTTPDSFMSAVAHKRLDVALDEISVSIQKRREPSIRYTKFSWLALPNKYLPSFFQASGWAVALVLFVVMIAPQIPYKHDNEIPMLRDILTEYYQIADTDLPSPEQPGIAVLPASWPNAKLLTSWKTRIGGAPAQAFALRSGNNIVFQFRIDETVLFRNAKVRQALMHDGNFRFQDENANVLVLPIKRAGLILVGPPDSLPSPQQMSFKNI